MSHTMKLWERVIDSRIRNEVTIAEQQFGFMPRRSTTDALFLFEDAVGKNGVRARKQCIVFLLIWRKHMIEYLERKCGNACR